MHSKKPFFRLFSNSSIFFTIATLVAPPLEAAEQRKSSLEEVIVTAQRREESLQRAPIAVSVLGREQLEAQGISSFEALTGGAVPTLRIMSAGNPSGTLIVAIRGNGPIDMQPVTREQTVGIYLDGIYLGRPQGLNMELADLERIEVLRGPQGTLFGRNTTSGAVSLITRKPTGVFGLEQSFGVGNYALRRSVTRLNLPEWGGVRAKVDYLHAERDGWVDNPAPGQWDYSAYGKDGGSVALAFAPLEDVAIDLTYDKSRVASTSTYYQLYADYIGLVGAERERATRVRAPIPNRPTYVYQEGAALVASWNLSNQLTLKSLTGWRKLDENSFVSFGAALYFDGAINLTKDRETQFSQELQLLGSSDRIEWVAGAYYFKADLRQDTQLRFALDTFGVLPGNAGQFNTPIDPPADFGVPDRRVDVDTASSAGYGQATWTAPILGDRLRLTAGARFTHDDKSGSRVEVGYTPYSIDTDHWDSALIADYAWFEQVSTYVKRATGYRSGSVNPRSESFLPFGPEKVETWELGLKSEFLQRRVRLNADVFRTRYKRMQFDFGAPTLANINNTETFNAARQVRVEGFEMDVTVAPAAGLLFGLSYVYLDGDMPAQPNPATGAIEQFEMPQTPRHSGALTVDYTFAPTAFGTLAAHVDVTSSSRYAHQAQDTQQQSGYTLLNARLSLGDIALGAAGTLQLSLWGKNLTDAEYPEFAFPLTNVPIALVRTWNEPRTYGAEVALHFR